MASIYQYPDQAQSIEKAKQAAQQALSLNAAKAKESFGLNNAADAKAAPTQTASPTAGAASGAANGTYTGYSPSQAVLAAQQYLQQQLGSKPGPYSSKYNDQLDALLSQYQNRVPFQYDATNDPLYNIYKDLYIQNGRRAMQDTIGNAAALTGGYGNSYAQSAGQQMYNQYMEGLNAVIPELQQQAYQRYSDEGDRLAQSFQMMNTLENQNYRAYRDTYGDWQTERQLAQEAALQAEQMDRQQYQYDTSFRENQRQYDLSLAEQIRQADLDEAYRQAQLAENIRQYNQSFDESVRQADLDEAYRQAQLAESQRQYNQSFDESVRQADLDEAYRQAQLAESQRQYNQSFDYQKYTDSLDEAYRQAQLAESIRQYNQSFGEEARQYDATLAEKIREFDIAQALDQAKFDYQVEQGKSSSGGSSGSSGSSSSAQTQKTPTQTAAEIQANASKFIAGLRTKAEYIRQNRGASSQDYEAYVVGKVENAMASGKLSDNEALAVINYYSNKTNKTN